MIRSAALYIDGKLIAAVEEERLVRDKHAKNRMPYDSAKFCLEQAGITPADVDVVTDPFLRRLAFLQSPLALRVSVTGMHRIAL